ncbi:HutD/Ves family protein [Streptomyces axinellae]
MVPSVLRWADRPRMPWKNGSGSTREVAAQPVGSRLADFDWRVSVADVGGDGPFSPFPGVDRVITLIDAPA